MVADRLRQLAELDDRAYAAPRMVAAALGFQRAGWITGLATRSAFSGAANTRGALQDRIHDWIGYCDQAGESATATMACPGFWQGITDALPDKLALTTIVSGLGLYVGAAYRQREPRVLCKLLTEHFLLWSLLLALRAAVVAATIVPAPSPLCRNATHWEQGPGGRPTKGWFLGSVDCNDAMFSGHTCLYSLVCVMWTQSYMPRAAKAAWVSFFLLCCVASVATRDHYTSDVLVATYITVPIVMHRAAAIRHLMSGELNDLECACTQTEAQGGGDAGEALVPSGEAAQRLPGKER
jgi:hypothetical protein